tara:strand:+ start:654 stop:854 length:201 start_codon:yes stop_codon:yes gene_type:complete
MKYRITEIDLDFDDSIGELPDLEKQDVIDEVLATTWEANDADDLVEEITSITGWCIKTIDYCYVLS